MVRKRQDAPMFYVPRRPPTEVREQAGYLYQELSQVAAALRGSQTVVIRSYRVAPAKPLAGQVVWADGEHWDPGAGAGIYRYDDGRWHRCWVVPDDEVKQDNIDEVGQ